MKLTKDDIELIQKAMESFKRLETMTPEEFLNALSNDNLMEKFNDLTEEMTTKKIPNPKVMFDKTNNFLDEVKKVDDKDEEV